MKLEILSAVIVTSSFSRHNGEVGLVLSGNANYSEVTFYTRREVLLSGEIVPLPKFFKLAPDKFITLCAWCESRDIAAEKKLTLAGWRISHTVCPACRERVMPKKIDTAAAI